MKLKKVFRLTLERRKALTGVIFVSPFILGFALFFLYPFIQSIQFSLSDLKVTPTGFTLQPLGLENYRRALFVNTSYVKNLVGVLNQMLTQVPVIIAFSFFAAVLVSQKYRGRTLARVIFFLPVILGSGIVLRIEQWDMMTSLLESGNTSVSTVTATATQTTSTVAGGMFGPAVYYFLHQINLPEGPVTYVLNAVAAIPDIIRSSGIQIVIFLAGLESIPSSLYEASEIEGASGWENFWMITFPMVSPLILTNVVFSVIDSFTSPTNALVNMIQDGAFADLGFGMSMAMSIMYFAVIALILGIVMKIISRGVFYHQ